MERTAMYYGLAEHYDQIYSTKDYAGEARRLARLARRYSPRARTLLDVACGTGRHLATFREQFAVAGVDASPPMLSIARRRLGRTVPLSKGDMRTFDLHRRFDVLVCLFSAIGYLTTQRDRRRAFRNFYRHLAPGGVALVEGWLLPSEFHDRSVHLQTYDGPEVKIARVSVATRRGSVSRIDMDYLVGDPRRGVRHWRESHREALVEPREMLETMRAAGFRASVLRTGPYRARGLYIGRRPARS